MYTKYRKQIKWKHTELRQAHSEKCRNSSEEGKGSTQHSLHDPEVGLWQPLRQQQQQLMWQGREQAPTPSGGCLVPIPSFTVRAWSTPDGTDPSISNGRI